MSAKPGRALTTLYGWIILFTHFSSLSAQFEVVRTCSIRSYDLCIGALTKALAIIGRGKNKWKRMSYSSRKMQIPHIRVRRTFYGHRVSSHGYSLAQKTVTGVKWEWNGIQTVRKREYITCCYAFHKNAHHTHRHRHQPGLKNGKNARLSFNYWIILYIVNRVHSTLRLCVARLYSYTHFLDSRLGERCEHNDMSRACARTPK